MSSDFDALDEAVSSDNTSSSSSTNEEYGNHPWVGITPRIAVKGTITDVGFTGKIKNDQNILGGRGDTVVTLEDPEVIGGDLFEHVDHDDDTLVRNVDHDEMTIENPDDQKTDTIRDYRLVDADESMVEELVKKVDGEFEEVGIEVYGTKYQSEETDSFTEDTIEVFVRNKAGLFTMMALDAYTEQSAFYRSGDGGAEKTKGLVEYPETYGTDDYTPWKDGSDDQYERIARTPVLHPDLEGQEIILYATFGESSGDGFRQQQMNVLLNDGEDLSECTNLTFQSDDILGSDASVIEYDPWMVWHEPDDVGGNSGSSSTSNDSSSDDGDGPDFDFDGNDDVDDYEGLTGNQQAFVEQAVNAIDGGSLDDTFGDFAATVDGAVDDGDMETIDAETLRPIIEDRV